MELFFAKSKNNYPSGSYTQAVLEEKDKISLNLLKGDVVCFSGHHLHTEVESDLIEEST